ncbi:hypothetical protein [Microvirga calopogonii]|uniref:hypothetical protein n=1 Tax=Microvirga calopogonii TaxID=2078013 RepID=UPI00197C5BAD|nr:hypothetical protein [Microvirga calopogonii]
MDLLGTTVLIIFIGLIGTRLTKGVDLTDEAYYAIFLDDWLKGGIATSAFLTLHQTAALIVYPAALIYVAVKGSSDGLLLFLRALFLIGAVASAAVWIVFMRRIGHRLYAWAGGLLILAFIPFGLPAPSYNTLGQQALTIAMASFGCAALAAGQPRAQLQWLIASACAWALATVAYPTMIAPMGFLCLLGLLYRDRIFPQPWRYALLVAAAVCIGWGIVATSLSVTRLYDSIIYLSAVADVGGMGRKLTLAFDILRNDAAFAILCLFAVTIGIFRRHLGAFAQIASVAIIGSLFFTTPALFVRSHDAITLAALTGIGLLTGLWPGASRNERVVALVYATSIAAALATSMTAFNSIFNFCIGAVPAAALSLVARPSVKSCSLVGVLPAPVAIAAVLSTSLYVYYGELQPPPLQLRERLQEGFFAGIEAHPDDAALLRVVRGRVGPLLGHSQTIAVIGRLPGLALATPLRLSMPTAFPLTPNVPQRGIAAAGDYYTRPENRPQLVLIYRDAYFEPINPMQQQFDEWYAPLAEFSTPLGQLAVFQRRLGGPTD